jgi:phage-related protein
MKHEFIYNGMNSRDYGLRISGEDTWTRPQPDITRISVPGRNGDLIQLGNRFQNLDITYHAGIIKDLQTNFDAFNAKLLTDPGYHRLEDSYHPEYFRMAVFESALEPDVKDRAIVGEVDIKFNCKPQLYLKSGEVEQKIKNGGVIYNPTPYSASPVLRFSFPNSEDGGSITINGVTMSIQKPGTSNDFIIDCERQDIYMRTSRKNMNNEFVLSNGEFFELTPGRNTIECAGLYLDSVYVTPNWWTV